MSAIGASDARSWNAGGEAPVGAGSGRQCDGRRRRAGGGAVDDQHRHRRYRRDRPPGGGAGRCRLRDRPHHGGPRRGRRRRAEDQGAAAQDRLRRADRRRLPLHRPQAPGRSSRLRRGARQVPHQSGQRRLQGQEGPAVFRHRRDGDQAQQAGAHRRQLGLARSGIADAPDGRERQVERSEGCPRGDARGDGAVGAVVGCARRGDRPAAQPHHPVGQGLGGAGPGAGLYRSRPAAPITRSISA